MLWLLNIDDLAIIIEFKKCKYLQNITSLYSALSSAVLQVLAVKCIVYATKTLRKKTTSSDYSSSHHYFSSLQ